MTSRHQYQDPCINPDRLPPPWDPSWDAFMAGYQAGIFYGIDIGRKQVEAEEHPIWAQIIADVNRRASALARRPGPLTYAEHEAWKRQEAEERAWHPGWTPEQIREDAARSWGLTTPARRAA